MVKLYMNSELVVAMAIQSAILAVTIIRRSPSAS